MKICTVTELIKSHQEQQSRYIDSSNQTIPFITLSYGMSMDGKIATITGDSKYISSSASRMFIHELRSMHDAILIGINTVEIDHPMLTTRLPNKKNTDPIRVILDSTFKIAIDEPLLHQSSNAKTIIVTRKNANNEKKEILSSANIEILEIDTASRPMELDLVLRKLYQYGIRSMLVEGGGTVHFSFIEGGYVDILYATISPIVLGGMDAKTAVEGKGFTTLKEAAKFQFLNQANLGEDIVLQASLSTINTMNTKEKEK